MEEFTTAFLCSPGVDPILVPNGSVRNHYMWFVWGLDSLDRRLVSSSHLVLKDSWNSLHSNIMLGSAQHKLAQKGKVVVGIG